MRAYTNAIEYRKEQAKGLTTTHQGGEAYLVDSMRQLRRFLILGSEGGTFYVSEKKLTNYNIDSVFKALKEHGLAAVNMIVEVSEKGLAPSNDPALLALAIAASYKDDENPKAAAEIRSHALAMLPSVARIGTHLFHFVEYANALRGWGSGLRKGVGKWYTQRLPLSLAQQVTKYQQRDGWSHADLLRLSHPTPPNDMYNSIFNYVVDGDVQGDGVAIDYLRAVEQVKQESSITAIVDLIRKYNLPREVIPTMALNEPRVWDAMLPSMGLTAMIRNLGTMSKIGFLTQGSLASRVVIDRLHDQEMIRKARIHPIDAIKAKLTYQSGRGFKSEATWDVVSPVVDALESAFYLSFGNVEPTNKRLLLALDVSGSMTFGELRAPNTDIGFWYHSNYAIGRGLANVNGLSPRIAASVLCMVTARVERDFEIRGFTTNLVDLNISKHDSLETVMNKTQRAQFGGTDCSQPIKYAMANKKDFDAFVVYTDNETGYENPSSALRQYRKKSGIHDAKLIVNAMTANQFSIADPTDPYMLDVVGFDSSAPQMMSEFIRGNM